MELISNIGRNNHRKRLVELINSSEKIILCTGWMKIDGLNKVLPSLLVASSDRSADITIYTNNSHTDDESIKELEKYNSIRHVVINNENIYLHTKLYYFEIQERFTAIAGSANITYGGLVSNEELSIEINGDVDSKEHRKFQSYLEVLSSHAQI